MKNSPNEEIVSISVASKVLGITSQALRKGVKKGNVPSHLYSTTPGGHFRFFVKELKKHFGEVK